MGRGKWIGIGVGVLLVFIIIVAIGASASQSTSVSSQSGNSPLDMTVTMVIADKTAGVPIGNTMYIYDVDIANRDNVRHPIYPLSFQLVSKTDTVYHPTISLAARQSLQFVELGTGQHAKGQIAFQLPDSEIPSKLEYKDSLNTIDISIANTPSPSKWVSYVGVGPIVTLNNGNAYYPIEWDNRVNSHP